MVAVVPLLFFETPFCQQNCRDAEAGMFSDIYSSLSTARRKGGSAGGGDQNLFCCNLTRPFRGLWLRSFDLLVDRIFTDISNFYFN